MTTRVVVRSAVADDAAAVAAVRRAACSYKVMSPAAARHLITVQTPQERFLPLVAESAGEIVAWGSAGLNVWTSQPGQDHLTIYVHPDHRKQGIATALADRLHQHLTEVGALRVRTFVHPDGFEFARSLGYDGTRQMHYSGVDPRSLPEQPQTPDRIELVPMGQVDPRQAYTSNDDENGPMLAINNWLGYQRVQTELVLLRMLAG